MLTITDKLVTAFGSQRDAGFVREENCFSLGELQLHLLGVGSDGLISRHLESGYNLKGEVLHGCSLLFVFLGQDGDLVPLGDDGVFKSRSHGLALGGSFFELSELVLGLAQLKGRISVGITQNLKVLLSLVEVCLKTINLFGDGVDEFIELNGIGGKLICQGNHGVVDGLGHVDSVLHFVSPTLYGLALTIKM